VPISSNSCSSLRRVPSWIWLVMFAAVGLLPTDRAFSQTASTGASAGRGNRPLRNYCAWCGCSPGGERKSVTSDENGKFGFLLLRPGNYELQASAKDFDPVTLPKTNIPVTECQSTAKL